MDKISGLLTETLILWAVTAAVVVVASVIHYVISSSDLEDLKKRSEDQAQKPQPEDFQEPSPSKP
jgi:hypothetical protein